MKVYIGTDHGGFELKEKLKKYVASLGYEVMDKGAFQLDPEDDYPDFIIPVAQAVSKDSEARGIVLGRSGNGEQIAANKIKGVRAALCMNETMAQKAREHNDANVISIGADYVDEDMAKKMIKIFLATPFSGEERHKRRLEKIAKYG